MGLVVPPIVIDPSSHNRVDLPGNVFKRFVPAPVKLPALDRFADILGRFVAHRRNEADEAFSLGIPCQSWPKTISQEVKLLVLMRVPAVVVLAICNFSFLGMEFQLPQLQPLLDPV